MPTFYIRPTQIGSNVNWTYGGHATDLLDGIRSTSDMGNAVERAFATLPIGTGLVRLDFSSDCIYLGSLLETPIAFSDLPIGFNIVSASLQLNYFNFVGEDLYLQLRTLDEKAFPALTGNGAKSFDYSELGNVPSTLSIVNNGCGIRGSSLGGFWVNQVFITGEYPIDQWSSDNPPLVEFEQGGTTPIVAPLCYDPTSGIVGPCTPSLTEPWIPDTPIPPFNPNTVYVTPNIIVPTFVGFNPIPFIPLQAPEPQQYNPVLPPEDPWSAEDVFYVYPVSVPTDDGYTVNVGGAADLVFIGSPSGIYTLVKGKLNDTLYNRGGTEATIDVEIPNPFIVTGFLGD